MDSRENPNRQWEDVRDEVRFAWGRAAGERASAVPCIGSPSRAFKAPTRPLGA